MPVSTTLKLPEKLKSRVTHAAKAAGKTPHAFMVEAIELQTALSERRREFLDDALAAREEGLGVLALSFARRKRLGTHRPVRYCDR